MSVGYLDPQTWASGAFVDSLTWGEPTVSTGLVDTPGGTSKRDKRLKKRRLRHHWEETPPVTPEVFDAATGAVLEPAAAQAADAATEQIRAEARAKLDERLKRMRRRKLFAAFLAALADEDDE